MKSFIRISLLFAVFIKPVLFYGQASNGHNYVITNTIKQPGITSEDLVAGLTIDVQGKSQSIIYFDGLGRPLQTVVTQGGASKKDIVSGNEYDFYGREVKKYLPYADINNTATPGSFKSGWITTQASFYNGQLQGVDVDAAPYSLSLLEASPLNRVLAQGAPGTVWQPGTNPTDMSTKATHLSYEINTTADNVRLFNVNMTSGAISSPGNYAAGLLTVKVSKDEHASSNIADGGWTKEFTDKSGHLLLKQVYIQNDVLQTYYIYDDLDLLRAMIQPEGVASIPTSGSWSPDPAFMSNWVFQYGYDKRRRMIVKIVPGATAVFMLYDQWDRVVATQDGNLRANNRWLFTKYDALNRPIITGSMMATSQSALQTEIDGTTNRYESVNTSASEGYTLDNAFPKSSQHTLSLYSITHYDSYSNLPSWAGGYSFVPENGVSAKNENMQGRIVGLQDLTLSTNNWMRSVSYYDDKNRVIQSTSDNAASGKDRVTRILTWDGKESNQYQTHSSNVYSTPIVIKKAYTYDHADRLLTVTHQIASGEVVTLADNSYNELGQLLNKKIHEVPSYPNGYLQKLDYAYNIRGWLNGVNTPYSDKTGYDETDLFNFELHYNNTNLQDATPAYNGNIAEQVWKGSYDEYLRGYKYTYDKANRLLTSSYGYKYLNAWNGESWDYSMRYDENVIAHSAGGIDYTPYDHNGNINQLERFHGSWNRIDNISYNYNDANTGLKDGNRLHKTTDGVYTELPVGFKDADAWWNDYNYDANGNLTNDYNKGINSITYNYLNQPTLVDFGGAKGTIEYLYDAAGNKLQKTVTDKSVSPQKITITKYAGAFVYTNSYLSGSTPATETLEFIAHEEGRVRTKKIDENQALTVANTKYIYDYFMKDHLGNTRMVLSTEQQTDLYAATQESANATKENDLFKNLSGWKTGVPAGFEATPNSANTQVTMLNGGTEAGRVGPGIILKVMAGDVISVSTKGFYNTTPVGPPSTPLTNSLKSQLATLLSGGIVSADGTHGGTIPASDIMNGIAGDPGTPWQPGVLDEFLNGVPYNSGQPKAFLNWMIVDEEFKKVNSSLHMGAVQMPPIGAGDPAQPMVGLNGLKVRRNGWLYVYLSNESNMNVYFDDLVINHKRGPVVEANNYYPFGMEIPGLASKAIGFGGNLPNRSKFNGGNEIESNEFSDGGGLEWYDATFRMYDPQIGRFHQKDPLAELDESWSSYTYVHDNPISFNDPLGLSPNDTATLGEVVVTACPSCNSRVGANIDVAASVGPPPSSITNPIRAAQKIYEGDQKGMITSAPAWMQKNYPVRAWLQNTTHDILDGWGINKFDDWLYDRFNGNNSAGEVTTSTIEVAHAFFSLENIEMGGGGFVRTGENFVYHTVENGITKYVGITNDLARRAAEHLAAKGIVIEPLLEGLSRADARAVEQALIEINGLEKNGGTLINKINSISSSNKAYSSQLQRGYELLQTIGYK